VAVERRLPPLLRRAWYSLNQAFRRRIAHLGITPDQYTVLRTVHEGDPLGMTQRELTDRMSSDPNTVASLVDRMVTAGLLDRLPHEQDRRAHRIRLRSSGEQKFLQAQEVARRLQPEVMACLSEEDRRSFLTHLESIADACRAAAEGSPRPADTLGGERG